MGPFHESSPVSSRVTFPSSLSNTLAISILSCSLGLVLAILIVPMGCDSQEPPYDFEWISPVPMPNSTDPAGWDLSIDGRTGDVYCTAIVIDPFNYTTRYLTYYRYDPAGLRFEWAGSCPVPDDYYRWDWDYTIFDGHCYSFFTDDYGGKLHLSLDGNASDPLNITLPFRTNLHVLATYNDEILLEGYHAESGYVFDLYSINADTLAWKKQTMFKYASSRLSSWTSVFRDGKYYWTQYAENMSEPDPSLRYQTLFCIYDIESAKTDGPTIFLKESNPHPSGFSTFPFDVDSHGDIHLLDPTLSKVRRFSPSGDLLGEISIPPPPYDGENYTVQWSTILINESDRIYLFGSINNNNMWFVNGITSVIVDREYFYVPRPRRIGLGTQF